MNLKLLQAIKKISFWVRCPLFVKVLLWGGLMFFTKVNAQDRHVPDRSINTFDTIRYQPEVEEKDLTDVFRLIFRKNTNKDLTNDSVLTKPIYSVVPAVGYSLQTKLAAVVSGNLVFNLSPEAKLSAVSANATYTQNKQFYTHIQPFISTKGNLYRLVGDYRFYKYPQSTFGLGSEQSILDEDPMVYNYLRFYQTVLRKLKGNLSIGLGFNLDYHWNISHEGNLNGTPSHFSWYDTSQTTTSSGLTFNALYDSRDNPINSKRGTFTNVQFRNNFKALGSNSNWRSITLDVRKYFPFPAKSNNVLAFWSYNVLVVSGKPPFLDLPSTGWDSYNSTGRGFIQGRYRGTKMVYLESEYRFKLTSNGLLGGAVFVNEQSFSSFPGTPLQAFQTGYGAGLRIKLNKKSNTNLAIDYGFGTQGSKGLFISVGEVF